MKLEEWKTIDGFENYMISDEGRIKSLYYNKNKNKEKILLLRYNNCGYLRTTLCNNGLIKQLFIHHLVAKYFIPNPLNKQQINHKNGIKTDNRAINLEWCTPSENRLHAFKIGIQKTRYGEDASHHKLTSSDVIYIRKTYSNNRTKTYDEIASLYGISNSMVSNILNNKRWKHLI